MYKVKKAIAIVFNPRPGGHRIHLRPGGGASFEPPSSSVPGRDSGKTRSLLDSPSKIGSESYQSFLDQVNIDFSRIYTL